MLICFVEVVAAVEMSEAPSFVAQPTAKTVDVDLIFADGFESGDTSAWGTQEEDSCFITSVDLPLPARGK